MRALDDPLRARIFVRLQDQVASPSSLAVEFDEPLERIAYSVNRLRDAGLIRMVTKTERGGVYVHHYTAARPLLDS